MIGRDLNRYRILEKLNVGGMGDVLRRPRHQARTPRGAEDPAAPISPKTRSVCPAFARRPERWPR